MTEKEGVGIYPHTPTRIGRVGRAHAVHCVLPALDALDASDAATGSADWSNRSDHWLLTFDGRDTLVTTVPAPTVADMQARYPGAVVRPLTRPQWLQHPEPTSCRSCAHLAKPGRADGYCGADLSWLEPAYGRNNVLRELPSDLGASCPSWSPA